MNTTQNNTFDDWLKKVTNSSLWAAYGDALGFITEMADEKKLRYRTGLSEISTSIEWKRKIGGMYGVNVLLPKGCYSDDTQLRLSVSRAIGHNGYFDIDSFAHIEIPVWMSYQLGGGVATNLAAKNLTKRSVGWATNFFKSKKSSYVNGGGNGAAMRIQPHVWSHPANLKSSDLVKNILIDSICTHGHPRGLLGALFHGFCLYYSMIENCAPKPTSWKRFLSELNQIPSTIQDDPMLGLAWLPTWEDQAKASFKETWTATISEMKDDINLIEPFLTGKGPQTYLKVVEKLDCFQPKWRGTGTKTALLASALVLIADNNPRICAQYSANALNSDTDTIGTMASAIAGALSKKPPTETVQDSDYISQEALKLTNIRFSKPSNIFVYPSISSWKAPKTNSDAVFEYNKKLFLTGLGSLESLDKSIPDSKGSFIWEWAKTSFGQTILVKRRSELQQELPIFGLYKTMENKTKSEQKRMEQIKLPTGKTNTQSKTIEELNKQVTTSGYSPEAIGKAILEASLGKYGIEKAVALTALIINNTNALVPKLPAK